VLKHLQKTVGSRQEYAAIIGDGRNYITALIVPSFPALEEWTQKNNITFTSRDDLVKNPKVIEHYKKIVDSCQESLGRVEKIKKFTILPKEFSQDEGEITPTMKVKRKVVEKKYSDIIDTMYQ
jgi:long-chain acyl-CoA synthetase